MIVKDISEHISIGVNEEGEVGIYVCDKLVSVCSMVLVEIPPRHVDDINSIDELLEGYDADSEEYSIYEISLEDEIFVHASNVEGWYLSGYDSRAMDSRIAFPVLERLYEHDPNARYAYMNILKERWEHGNEKSRRALVTNLLYQSKGYVDNLEPMFSLEEHGMIHGFIDMIEDMYYPKLDYMLRLVRKGKIGVKDILENLLDSISIASKRTEDEWNDYPDPYFIEQDITAFKICLEDKSWKKLDFGDMRRKLLRVEEKYGKKYYPDPDNREKAASSRNLSYDSIISESVDYPSYLYSIGDMKPVLEYLGKKFFFDYTHFIDYVEVTYFPRITPLTSDVTHVDVTNFYYGWNEIYCRYKDGHYEKENVFIESKSVVHFFKNDKNHIDGLKDYIIEKTGIDSKTLVKIFSTYLD
jgi:hypothetical protein